MKTYYVILIVAVALAVHSVAQYGFTKIDFFEMSVAVLLTIISFIESAKKR